MAITAGVRELKNRLTHYLRLVEQGERVIVTDRHRPIAILQSIEEEFEQASIEERLASLSRTGGLTLAEPGQRRKRWRAARSRGTPPSRIVRDDRASRR